MTSATLTRPAPVSTVASGINTEAETAFIRARTALYIEHPLYGVLSLRLGATQNPAIPTLCVSHKHLYYNPEFFLDLDRDLQKSAIAHEVDHIMKNHLNRCGNRNPAKWNAACDYVVNLDLQDAGFTIGEKWLLNPHYRDMSADHVYLLLPDQDGDGNEWGDGELGGAGGLDGQEPDATQADMAESEVEWTIASIQAANIAEAQGKLPAKMKRVMDELRNGKVDWRAKLRQFATEASDADYDWSHPQRRMLPFGYIMPSLYSEAVAALVNAIDTSGSISKPILDAFGAEITAMRDAVAPEKIVNIYCDAEVAHVDTYEAHDPMTFVGHGGGGTDFRPPFDYVAKHGIKPSCFIYLTDGYGPFPDAPPPYPVLWVMTSNVVPPWGDYVKIEI